jgi:3-isopropylmalate/(R)-2-methylmalate dehydratase large subunit
MAQTLFDTLWCMHEIARLPDGVSLLHIDRHYMHELTGAEAMDTLAQRPAQVRNPELTFATLDHVTSTRPGVHSGDADWSTRMIDAMRARTKESRITLFDEINGRKGIVHVVGPELGLTLPGLTIACADSHTCTHGALGAIAMGIGSSQLVHVLATQTLRLVKPRTFRIHYQGDVQAGITAKDIILHTIGELGAAAGTGYAIEYTGKAIEALDMEGRMTLCNLSIELGSRIGMVAPDDVTFHYLRGRPYAPCGDLWIQAQEHWRTLRSHPDAHFDKVAVIDAGQIQPKITWGTSPEHVADIGSTVPNPQDQSDPDRRKAYQAALDYMGLQPGQRLDQVTIDRVFIGSCTNSRLSDLRAAAQVLRGRRVAAGVQAWVVPGSMQVKRDAEAEGLDHVFLAAGAQWREPGCSMCVGANGDIGEPGQRIVSTSNRNFVGRQGPGVRTHLASPAIAAASAVLGRIASPAMLR